MDKQQDEVMYQIIGNRADELSKIHEVQIKMVEIGKSKGKEVAERWLYLMAIRTLIGE